MKLFAAYAAAGAIGVGVAAFVLWLARSAAVGADPLMAALGVVITIGVVAALLAAAAPRHWLALVLSLPVALLGIVMFSALANVGEFFWIWLIVGLGALGAAMLGAYLVARGR